MYRLLAVARINERAELSAEVSLPGHAKSRTETAPYLGMLLGVGEAALGSGALYPYYLLARPS